MHTQALDAASITWL